MCHLKPLLQTSRSLMLFSKENESARIATVSGRYYAMDRDKRWERTKLAYDALTLGVAPYTAQDGETAVSESYNRGEKR